jgi:hypothetical protein
VRLFRAKEPRLPDTLTYGTGGMPPLGASPEALDWLWGMIGAGMVTGQVPALAPVVERDVLALPAVSASLSLIVSQATQMPLEAVVDTGEDDPPAVVEPTPVILRGPLGDPRATN